MKRILLLLFMTALSLSQTHAKDTNTATDWTGTYNTNFGQIILHQKANYVVGTYRDLGGIRSMYVSNNQLIGVFYNNGKEGHLPKPPKALPENGDGHTNSKVVLGTVTLWLM